MEAEQVRVTRGMVVVARAIDTSELTWKKAAERAGIDPPTLGRVLKGQTPGIETISKLRTTFGTDANLWLEEASHQEREEWERRMASMRQRATDAVHGRTTPSPEAP